MTAFIEQHLDAIVALAIALTIVIFVLCIVAKLFKVAIGILILSILVPILFTIFWGDGSEYVSKFAGIFNDRYQQQIEDAYAYYRDKEAEDPFVDQQAVSEFVTDLFPGADTSTTEPPEQEGQGLGP